MKPRSGRTIPLYFKVSPEEKEIIEKKMAQLGIHNQRAYLRKMAVDGYAVQVDMSDFKALVSLLRNCSNNLNQIAKRVNSTGNLYQEDVADLQERYRELWGAVSTLLECLVAFEAAARCFFNRLLILKKVACVYQP